VRPLADLEDPVTDTAGNPTTTSHIRLIAPTFRALHPPKYRMAILAILAFLSGIGTTSSLVLLIQVALRISQGDGNGSIGIPGIDMQSLSVGVMFAAALIAAGSVLIADLIAATQTARIIAEVQSGLRESLFEAWSQADWETRTSDRAGHLQDLSATNVTRALNLTAFVNAGIVAALSLTTMLASATLISPAATGLLLLSLLAIVSALVPLAGGIRSAAEATRQANHRYAIELAEFTEIPTEITTFGVSSVVESLHRHESDRLAARHSRLTRLERAIPSLQRNSALLAVLATMAVIYHLGLAGVGELGAVVILLGRSLTYAQSIQQTINKFAAAGPFVLTLDEEICRYRRAARPSTGQRSSNNQLPVDGSIALGAISYSHPGSHSTTLEDISCNIADGEFVAIVGPSGSGKTTLAEILLRLRSPDNGDLMVGTVRADQVADDDWAATVSYVPQKPRLMTGTVADNVRFHRGGIDDRTVDESLRAAGLLGDTDLLPQGRDTHLGNASRQLSGGQLQRLAIARALAGSPKVIILDEPTSALDPANERAIHETLLDLVGSITLVVIAHRASIVGGCDRIISMDSGRIVAEGRPNDLISSPSRSTSDFALEVVARQ